MGIFLLVIGLLPMAFGVLVLAVANAFPSDVPKAWAAIIVGGAYIIVGIIHMKTRILNEGLRTSHTPFWLYIVALLPILVLCYMQLSPLYR